MSTMAPQITSLTIVYWAFIQVQIIENIKAPLHRPLWLYVLITDWSGIDDKPDAQIHFFIFTV